jgi:hypothetical protein
VYVTDLSHYDGIDGDPAAPAAAARFADHLRMIGSSATARAAGSAHETALRCRRRPGHRPCPGHLVVQRVDVPAEITWHCPSCGENGVITGWAGSPWDLSRLEEAGDGPVVTARVSEDDYRRLLSTYTLDRDCQLILYRARMVSGAVELAASSPDMENLIEFIAAEANHADSRKRQRELDSIYQVLDAAMPKP